ncbi:hypothetical protein JXO52_14970 [bacterium]|nr:hypothetical protein [bacterium]
MHTEHAILADRILKIVLERWISKPLYIAAEPGITDLLADGPIPVSAVAGQAGLRVTRMLQTESAVHLIEIHHPRGKEQAHT